MRALELRLLLLVLAIAATFVVWQQPLPPAIFAHEETEKAEAAHQEHEELAVQAYYHRAFFGEPWREPERSERLMLRHTCILLDALLIVELALAARRRKLS